MPHREGGIVDKKGKGEVGSMALPILGHERHIYYGPNVIQDINRPRNVSKIIWKCNFKLRFINLVMSGRTQWHMQNWPLRNKYCYTQNLFQPLYMDRPTPH